MKDRLNGIYNEIDFRDNKIINNHRELIFNCFNKSCNYCKSANKCDAFDLLTIKHKRIHEL